MTNLRFGLRPRRPDWRLCQKVLSPDEIGLVADALVAYTAPPAWPSFERLGNMGAIYEGVY
jgi:hypothetical protein